MLPLIAEVVSALNILLIFVDISDFSMNGKDWLS